MPNKFSIFPFVVAINFALVAINDNNKFS